MTEQQAQALNTMSMAAQRILGEVREFAGTDDDHATRKRHERIVRTAEARLAEMQMLLAMAAGKPVQAHPGTAELHRVLKQYLAAQEHSLNTNGLNLQGDIENATEAVENFLVHQEEAAEALDQAKMNAAFLVLHMGRAMESMKNAIVGRAVPV